MSLRLRVLSAYKSLHRSRLQVFCGDADALEAGKLKIREEFRKNLHVKEEEKINRLAKQAEDYAVVLRKTVVQAQLDDDVYKITITKDTVLKDNVPLKKS